MTKAFTKFRPRILILSSLVILSWTGLTMRFFYIQVIRGADLREQSHNQGQNRAILSAVRGKIRDRNHIPLAENIIHYSFAVHPEEVENREEIITSFSEATGRSRDYYEGKLNSSSPYVYLERNLRSEVGRELMKIRDRGLITNRHGYRFYPHQRIASQVLGFTNVDNLGLEGIEKEFDGYLKGRDGWIVLQRDGKGRDWRNHAYPRRDPMDGSDIVLTLDLHYQAILQDELGRRVEQTGAAGGMGLLVDPHTGRILALACLPDFDLNEPAAYSRETYRNKVVTDQFEPGSTFKIVTAAAALTYNTVGIQQEFNCENGSYIYRGQVIKDWNDFGLLTFSQIIANSSNVGTVKIAETVGRDRIYTTGRKFGFGSVTGIQFPGETKGVLKETDQWSGISLAEISLGYEVSVTTLQLAAAYSAIANGGFLMKPFLVDRIIHPTGKVTYASSPQLIRKVASRPVMERLTSMLCQVVETGTGTSARLKGWNIAGKTGTAKKYLNGSYSDSKFIASFVGFFPAHDPILTGVIILDEPKPGYHWGGTGAAPVFRELVKRIINSDDSILAHRPTEERGGHEFFAAADPISNKAAINPVALLTVGTIPEPEVENGMAYVPDVRGKSLRRAVADLKNAGLTPKVQGSGTVVWQSPAPGKMVKLHSACTVGLN